MHLKKNISKMQAPEQEKLQKTVDMKELESVITALSESYAKYGIKT